MPGFVTNLIDGTERHSRMTALGGDVDGVLREYVVFDQKLLTKIPDHLSHEEASTIPCAGVTAWSALDMGRSLKAESALLQGTGGVSMFAAILCLAAGIKAIITSSSDQKLEDVKKLGTQENAIAGINYRLTPDWDEEAKKLTDGLGVDVVINNVGPASMEKSLSALVVRGGTVSLVGFLGGMSDRSETPDCVLPVMMKGAKTVYVSFPLFLKNDTSSSVAADLHY